jgi:regulatory protein
MKTGVRQSAPDPSDPADCRRRALDLLARRDHSRLELERKLAARGYAPETVAEALNELERGGLLAARRFVESFVRSRAARLQGPVRIRAALAERGIGAAEAADFLDGGEHDWAALAARARVKRFGPARPADFKERARQARFLSYRGFEPRQIDAALALGGDED